MQMDVLFRCAMTQHFFLCKKLYEKAEIVRLKLFIIMRLPMYGSIFVHLLFQMQMCEMIKHCFIRIINLILIHMIFSIFIKMLDS